MREIKFRAFNEKHGMCGAKEMRELGVNLTFDGKVLFDNYADETSRWEVLQWTGLKDKNGVDVFEGDVVVWEVDTELSSGHQNVDTVEFADGHFWPVSGPTHTCYYSVYSPKFEVIGNKFEGAYLSEREQCQQ